MEMEPGVCIVIAEGQHDPEGAHLTVDLALLDKQIHELEVAREGAALPDVESLEGLLNMLASLYWHLSGGTESPSLL